MTETIKGSVVLITGATGTIAKALIAKLKARGVAKIYAAARDKSGLAASSGLVPIKMDVTNDADVAKAVSAASDVTLLINNAGINHNTSFMTAPDLVIAREEIEINYLAPLRVAARLARLNLSNCCKTKGAIMTKLSLVVTFAALAIGVSTISASADSIPGLRGHDHTGVTVPDVKAATAFFTDVLGCKHAMSFGPFMDDKGTFMQDVVNVNPRAVIEEISMVRCGYGSNIELFQYKSPDQVMAEPKNSDYGGHHIALYVDDIAKAAEYLRSKNVRTMQGPIPVNDGPAAGQSILYFLTPWGMQMELISYPKGMAYEKNASTVLWSTTEPTR